MGQVFYIQFENDVRFLGSNMYFKSMFKTIIY